jgi:Exopolyphosphatase
MKIGILDIGSNSVRLMISEDGKTLYKKIDTTRLSEGLALTGKISEEAAGRTLAAIGNFQKEAQNSGAPLYAFATEAVRSAENGREFAAEIKKRFDIEVDVISGEREAEYGFSGAYTGGKAAIFDIGGASVEVMCGDESGIKYLKSLPLGVLRIRDLFGEDRERIDAYLGERFKAFGPLPYYESVTGIGGTPSTLAAIELSLEPYDPKKCTDIN